MKEMAKGFANAVTMEGTTHTGEVGTWAYCAPEVVCKQRYGLSSDLWSCGVVLLEMINNKTLQSSKNKQAFTDIAEAKDALPDNKPFPTLVRGLLSENPSERLTARQSLVSPVFDKFGLYIPQLNIIDFATALPFDDDVDNNDQLDKENE